MPRRTQVLPRLSPRFRIRECHPLRCAFPCASPIMSSRLCRQPYNPIFAMVWAPPLSLAATYGIVLYFLLLQVLRCFSSLRLASSDYLFIRRYHPSRNDGFPHSDIDGSLPAYCSPSRFAVRCVLLRLLVPRHPPYALSCLA